jgi:hemoglobin/transferrin/lactoferrin receptor protein
MKRRQTSWISGSIAGLMIATGAWAQEQPPVLPPDVVTPQPTETEGQATDAGTDFDSSGMQGGSDSTNAGPFPGLSEQTFGTELSGPFGNLDSVTRGSQSVFDLPYHASIVDRRRLEEKQTTDMFRALQGEVGVLMQQTARGQVSPFIRGLTGQQVLILVDGVRVNNSIFRAGPNQYFNLIDPGQVERIEVLRGAQSSMWGADAIGGVINVVTRSASPYGGNYGGGEFREVFSTADSGSYTRMSLESWHGDGGFFGGGSYLNVNDLDTGGDLGRQPFTNYSQYAGDVKYDYLLSDDAMLTVALQHFEQEDVPRSDRFAPFVFGPPSGSPRPTFFDPQQRDLAYMRLQGVAYNSLFDAYSTTVSYGRNKESYSEFRAANRTDLAEFDVDTIGFTQSFVRDMDVYGKFVYGFDYYYDDVDAVRNRLNPLNGVVTPDNPQFPNDATYDRFGTFINYEVWLTDRLLASAGARYENANAEGTINAVSGTRQFFTRTYQDWVGGVGLTYEVTPIVHLVGSISEGYRAPNLDDLTADNPVLQNAQDIPSLDVEAEHSITYEVGVKYDDSRLRMQAFYYWNDLEDAILRQAVDANGNPVPNVMGPNGVLVPGSGNFIRGNFDSFIEGTEIAGEYMLWNNWFAYGNFWYTFGRDLDRNEPFSRIPPTQGIAGLRWRDNSRRTWIDMYAWMVAGQDRYAVQNNTDARFPLGGTPGYTTFNVSVGQTFGSYDQHTVSLGLENIGDTDYRVLGSGVDGAGFNAIFGYMYTH